MSPPARGQLTSASSPDQLAASYAADPVPGEVVIRELISASLTVKNTGRAVWLAAAPGERGAVKVGSRWQGRDGEEPGGRAALRSDVLPGQEARLTARISAPAIRGDYILVIDLVSEHVTWFADVGSAPVRVSVRVRSPEVERLLSERPPAAERAPVATVVTDRGTYRPRDRLQLTVTLTYPSHPRKFDAYLVLQGPEGAAFMYDGRGLSRAAEEPWRAWVKELPLPARAEGRFTLPLTGLAAGAYRWHVVLTEAGTHHPAVRTMAAFRIES